MNAGYHAMFVGLTTGTLALAFLALTYRLWFRPRRPAAVAAWQASDSVALYAALIGTAILILAVISGFTLRPIEAFLNSPITKNKILTAFLAAICWGGFLAIRLKGGAGMWRHRVAAHGAYVFALAGFIFLVTTNSIGGDISGIPSGYERIAQSLGFRTRHAVYFPMLINITLVVIGALALALAFRGRAASSRPPV